MHTSSAGTPAFNHGLTDRCTHHKRTSAQQSSLVKSLSYPVRPNGPLKDNVKYATQACEEYVEETTHSRWM
jgi:hypothetical protein